MYLRQKVNNLICCNALLLQSIIQASVRNMAEGGASGPPDLISGMVQPVDLVNSVTRLIEILSVPSSNSPERGRVALSSLLRSENAKNIAHSFG